MATMQTSADSIVTCILIIILKTSPILTKHLYVITLEFSLASIEWYKILFGASNRPEVKSTSHFRTGFLSPEIDWNYSWYAMLTVKAETFFIQIIYSLKFNFSFYLGTLL